MTTITSPAVAYWRRTFDGLTGYIACFSGTRAGTKLQRPVTKFFPYPFAVENAAQWLQDEAAAGREAYAAANLFTDNQRRDKHRSADVATLWADGDGATIPGGFPCPTITVETSPSRWNYLWVLTRAIPPAEAEDLNRRLAYAIGADKGGWDIGQLLRLPGLPNFKYEDAPIVTIVDDRGPVHDPDELRAALPPAPAETPRQHSGAGRPLAAGAADDTAADEPPIELNDHDLAVWKGEAPKRKPRGEVDRSATLLKIGRVLFDNGMTRRGVVSELRDRDHQLNFHKYCCGRSDGDTRYRQIVDVLEVKGRSASGYLVTHDEAEPAPGQNGSGEDTPEGADGCPSCEKLSVAYTTLGNQYGTLRRERAAVLAVLGNEGLTAAERIAGLITVFHVREHPRRADNDGAVPAYVPAVAARAGLPERTYSRTLKSLEAYGWADRRYADVPAFNRETRTYDPTRKVRQLRVILPTAAGNEDLAALAALKPERVRAGGARPRQCPTHPEAAVYKHTTYRCSVCHEVARELNVDADTGEVFGYGHTPPDPGHFGGGDEDATAETDSTEQPPLFTANDEPPRQNGRGATGRTHGQNGRGAPLDPKLCAQCQKRPPNPCQRLCQECVLANVEHAEWNQPRRKRGAA